MIESCADIVIAAKHGEITKVKDASGIAHTVGTLRCKFDFRTTDWDYTTRTAVFCKGNVSTHPKVVDTAIGVALDGVDECAVPPEVLLPDEKYFSVGVWGVTNEGLRIVSGWLVYRIKDGCYVESTTSFLPTPSVYEQIMIAINSRAPIDHKHNEYLTEENLAGKKYATETFVEEYMSEVALGDYALKEELPTKTSDLTNDSGFIKEIPSEYVTETELNNKGYLTDYTETDPTVPEWAKAKNKPSYTAEEVGALPNTTKLPKNLSDLLEDANHRVVTDEEKARWDAMTDYVDDKFNGANKAVSFDDYSSMVASLNTAESSTYNVGQNIMIVTLEVPDLWVSEITAESVAHTYVSDADFIDVLKTNGYVQVGYYKLSALETQKVDLTEYAQISELEDKVSFTDKASQTNYGVVKTYNSYGVQMYNGDFLATVPASDNDIITRDSTYKPITPKNMDKALKTSISTNTETLTDEEKASACGWIGALPKQKTQWARFAYTNDEQGNLYMMPISGTNMDDYSLVRRVGRQIKAITPVEDGDVPNKKYVDDRFNGANKAVSFVDYSSMITSLSTLEKSVYSVGQNIMIVTLEVPDLWVSEILTESKDYIYTSDIDFINVLKTNGYIDIGWYRLSALETQKVDLSEYVDKKAFDDATQKLDNDIFFNKQNIEILRSDIINILTTPQYFVDMLPDILQAEPGTYFVKTTHPTYDDWYEMWIMSISESGGSPNWKFIASGRKEELARSFTIDTELNAESSNPVENRVILSAIQDLDMYITGVEGQVADKADEWEGHAGGYQTLRARMLVGGISKTFNVIAAYNPTSNAIVMYNSDEGIRTKEPTLPAHAANKEYVDNRCNGANKALSFENYETMVGSLNILENSDCTVGQNIMIVTLNVPDLWISQILLEKVTYEYLDDNTIIESLKNNGYIDIGYYRLSALETQKVDLSEFAKKEDVPAFAVTELEDGTYSLIIEGV